MAKIETMIKWESETSQRAKDKILDTLNHLHMSNNSAILLAAMMENIYLIGKIEGTQEAGQIARDAIGSLGKAVQS